MRVDVDPSREDVLTGGIEQALGIVAREIATERNDTTFFDSHIRRVSIGSRNHGAVGNNGVETHCSPCPVIV